ncbi:hypothetical protein ACFVJH_08285 [Streptomyces decoyicus]|uniref:hypothetical protein n=1 Tax=Streptomyces decoyicus TaxID=249567 RepID=UPI00362E0A0E
MRVSLVVALVVALTGAGAFFGLARANSPGSGTATVSTPVAGRAVSPSLGHPWTQASDARPQASPMQSPPDPADVVQTYFSAVNEGDYIAAWALGGKQRIAGNTFDAFVQSFNTTNTYEVTINEVVGNKVEVELDQLLTDETHRHFTGTFTVEDGVIVAADIRPK